MNLKDFKNILTDLFKKVEKEDKFRLKGIFDLETYKDNVLIDKIHEDNIIVNTSFDIISSLFVDGDINKKINTLKLGDGGIYNSSVKTPVVTETDLYNPITTKKIPTLYTNADVLKDSLNKMIIFTWTFETNEGNGLGASIYSEAGLFSDDGIMFSKKNFTEVVKTEEKKMIVKWTIKIV